MTVVDLINWRASLAADEQYQLGGLKGFCLPGMTTDLTASLAKSLISSKLANKGNEKGAAVASGCPENGPYTDLEMAALLDWANLAVARRTLHSRTTHICSPWR